MGAFYGFYEDVLEDYQFDSDMIPRMAVAVMLHARRRTDLSIVTEREEQSERAGKDADVSEASRMLMSA